MTGNAQITLIGGISDGAGAHYANGEAWKVIDNIMQDKNHDNSQEVLPSDPALEMQSGISPESQPNGSGYKNLGAGAF